MPFECPQCQVKNSLQILTTLELGPAAGADETMIQLTECSHCEFQALAIYQESRGGALEGEAFSHQGYPLAKEQFQLLTDLFRVCPDGFKRMCGCQAHQELARHAALQDWVAFSQKNPFTMKLAPRSGHHAP